VRFKLVVVDKWLLFGGGRYDRFVCDMNRNDELNIVLKTQYTFNGKQLAFCKATLSEASLIIFFHLIDAESGPKRVMVIKKLYNYTL
jgi:hypothetical protein